MSWWPKSFPPSTIDTHKSCRRQDGVGAMTRNRANGTLPPTCSQCNGFSNSNFQESALCTKDVKDDIYVHKTKHQPRYLIQHIPRRHIIITISKSVEGLSIDWWFIHSSFHSIFISPNQGKQSRLNIESWSIAFLTIEEQPQKVELEAAAAPWWLPHRFRQWAT